MVALGFLNRITTLASVETASNAVSAAWTGKLASSRISERAGVKNLRNMTVIL
jgi:hypothetical protein